MPFGKKYSLLTLLREVKVVYANLKKAELLLASNITNSQPPGEPRAKSPLGPNADNKVHKRHEDTNRFQKVPEGFFHKLTLLKANFLTQIAKKLKITEDEAKLIAKFTKYIEPSKLYHFANFLRKPSERPEFIDFLKSIKEHNFEYILASVNFSSELSFSLIKDFVPTGTFIILHNIIEKGTHTPAEEKHMETLITLLDEDSLGKKYIQDNTLLHVFIMAYIQSKTHKGQAKLLEFINALIEKGADPNLLNKNNHTVLDIIESVEGENKEIKTLLRKHGAKTYQEFHTELMSIFDRIEKIDTIGKEQLEKLKNDVRNDAINDEFINSPIEYEGIAIDGYSLLYVSVEKYLEIDSDQLRKDLLAIIKILLQRGANPNTHDSEGKSPLFYCNAEIKLPGGEASKKAAESLKILLLAYKADPNLQDIAKSPEPRYSPYSPPLSPLETSYGSESEEEEITMGLLCRKKAEKKWLQAQYRSPQPRFKSKPPSDFQKSLDKSGSFDPCQTSSTTASSSDHLLATIHQEKEIDTGELERKRAKMQTPSSDHLLATIHQEKEIDTGELERKRAKMQTPDDGADVEEIDDDAEEQQEEEARESHDNAQGDSLDSTAPGLPSSGLDLLGSFNLADISINIVEMAMPLLAYTIETISKPKDEVDSEGLQERKTEIELVSEGEAVQVTIDYTVYAAVNSTSGEVPEHTAVLAY